MKSISAVQTSKPAQQAAGLESVDLTLRLVELLAGSKVAKGVTEVALELGISKTRAHRHLRCLVELGYAYQDPRTEGYEVGIRVLALGEMVRDRFDIARLMYPVMARLGELSGFAVTLAGIVEGAVTVLEMVPGRGLFEFTIRPGARMGLLTSAHGLVTLAYGAPELLDAELAREGAGSASKTAERIRKSIAEIRKNGWARSVDGVQVGFGALAAPVFDHRGALRASIAIVGSVRDLTSSESPAQEAMIKKASVDASHLLGWRGDPL